ncbi:phage tail protein [Chloroflexota bacterium]
MLNRLLRTEAYRSAKFGVSIENVVTAEFTEASGLEAQIEIFEYQEGGNNMFVHKLPGRVKYPNVTLKRGIIASNDLWDWFQQVMNRKIKRQNISIVLYGQNGLEVRRWDLDNAYPIKWTGPPFKADGNVVAIESIEFVHEGMTVQDPWWRPLFR